MPDSSPSPTALPPDVVNDVTAFVRTLVTATRAHQMYEAHHPSAEAAVERCRAALAPLAGRQDLILGVTPDTLLVNDDPLPPSQRTREACTLLNDRDIVRLHIQAQPTSAALNDFLLLLTFDPDAIRRRGGPARVWEGYSHYWLTLDQIDYDSLLTTARPGTVVAHRQADGTAGGPLSRVVRDAGWRSIVRSMADGRTPFDRAAERRLLDISGSAEAIGALVSDTADEEASQSAAQRTAQAAAVLMTFQRLSSFVELQQPADLPVVLDNIAQAAMNLAPDVLLGAASEASESGLGKDVVKGIGERFDDTRVAELLATTMAAEGKASARMAAALSTLVPDQARRSRVVRLARRRSGESAEGSGNDLASVWLALERFLDGPADAAYVSRLYGETLEQVEARSNRMRLDAPPKLDEWVRSVSSESVRLHSAQLLLDLFQLERHPHAMVETAKDIGTLVDDLLVAGDATEAARLAETLQMAVDGDEAEHAAAAQVALDDVARGTGLREMAMALGDTPDEQFDGFRRLCLALGPAAAPALVSAICQAAAGATHDRLELILRSFKTQALESLAARGADCAPEDAHALAQVVLGLGGTRAVSLLVTWARGPRPALAREAVHALMASTESAATHAIASVLRAGSVEQRLAMSEAVITSRHPGASAQLAGALLSIQPLGDEFSLALRLIDGLRQCGGPEAPSAISRMLDVWSWRALGRSRLLRRRAVAALVAIQTPESHAVLEAAAAKGSHWLKRSIRSAAGGSR